MAFKKEVIDGKFILLKIDGNPIAYSTSGSLSITQNTKDIKYKQTDRSSAVWKQTLEVDKEWTVESEAYVSAAAGDGEASYFDTLDVILGNLSDGKNSVEVVFEYVDGTSSFTLTGEAVMTSHSTNAGNAGDEVTYSISLQGNGPLTKVEIAGD